VSCVEAKKRLLAGKFIAITRGTFRPSDLLRVAGALLAGGITVIEVTLNNPYALEGIRRLRQRYTDDLLVGAGTVRTTQDLREALGAGASFLVSPHLEATLVEAAREVDILYLPGVLTPTEVQGAHALGCRLVKLFPAEPFGPAYLKALRGPLDDLKFVPTGGVDETNFRAYLKAGAVAVGLGGSLITGPAQGAAQLTERAAHLVKLLNEQPEG